MSGAYDHYLMLASLFIAMGGLVGVGIAAGMQIGMGYLGEYGDCTAIDCAAIAAPLANDMLTVFVAGVAALACGLIGMGVIRHRQESEGG